MAEIMVLEEENNLLALTGHFLQDQLHLFPELARAEISEGRQPQDIHLKN
jgi:hypothetical protein